MSKIGRNIKKIRSIKKINQNEFANLFGISRASVGAYEEGRAEPKIETIIKISAHFDIEVDKLLKNDLQVNDISGFKIDSSKLNIQGNNLTSGRKLNIREMDLVSASTKKVKKTTKLALPVQNAKGEYLALNDNNISICYFTHNPADHINQKVFIETPKSYQKDRITEKEGKIYLDQLNEEIQEDMKIYVVESEILSAVSSKSKSIEERLEDLERTIYGK